MTEDQQMFVTEREESQQTNQYQPVRLSRHIESRNLDGLIFHQSQF